MEARSVLQGLALGHDDLLGDPEVCIAVLDGPVDLSHRCFAGADLQRVDTLVQEPAGLGPMSLHGTHVTSLIFGQPGTSVVGIAPRCRGLILPVFRDTGSGRVPQLDLARAIERAVEEGAHVITVSGGERTSDGQAESMLERALGLCARRGVLVVAAVGNDGCDCLQVPAAVPSVLAVGATGSSGEPLEINNWGVAYSTNGVLAPGRDIEGAAPGGGTVALTGSSFATPVVSGVAALLVAAQLQRGDPADPSAVGRAILESASSSACSPSEAPECRRHLVGNLNPVRAYDLVTARGRVATAALDHSLVPSGSGRSLPQEAEVLSAGLGLSPAGTPASADTARCESNEGVSMDQQHTEAPAPEAPTTGAEPDASANSSEAPPDHSGSGRSLPQEAEVLSAGLGLSPAGTPASADTARCESNEGVSMDQQHTEAPAPEAPTTGAEPDTMAAHSPSPTRTGASCGHGVGASCEGSPTPGCTCSGNGSRPLIYAIGTIGIDFQTEARRDSFRQQMPYTVVTTADGRDIETQPNPYDPEQLHTYLSLNPWASNYVTWTLNLDSTPIYALEAEPSVAMDWHEPILNPKWTKKQVGEAAKAASESPSELAQLLETLSYPPVSTIYRAFRDAFRGQALAADDAGYVSRVSIPGVLTGETVRLYSGAEVPRVQVKSRGIWTWNEAALVEAVVEEVKRDAEERQAAVSELTLRTTIRAFLDMIYWRFRNLGQTSADRALNAAGTNAFLFGGQIREGLLSAKHVPGSEDHFYALESISVSKSPFCRKDSDCQDVRVTFFDPEDERRARVNYLLTWDVSDVDPISLGPPHTFIGDM